ncbi:hypothetical protein B0H13DRAFT_2532998 [Mycena leptocephala]|nr:hypothetical protein B0H13DRAFT_2532998 [Mycena leptocephala]
MADSKPEAHWYVQLRSVKVPEADYQPPVELLVVQRLKRLLAPTTSRAFTVKDAYFKDEFEDQVSEYGKVRNRIKQLYLVYRSHRLSQLNEIVTRLDLPHPPAQWDDEISHEGKLIPEKLTRAYQLSDRDIELLDQYCASIKRTRTLRSHLKDIEEDLAHYSHTIETQATAELTYFRGFRDWCQVMVQLTGSLSNSLITVSTLGAGLAYSTIFGCATRGNVALMCYCFPFFVVAFSCPSSYNSCCNGALVYKKKSNSPVSNSGPSIFMSISSLSVIAALTILNLTVFLLKPDDSVPDPPSTMVPGIIAFSVTGSIFLLMLSGVLLSAIAVRAFTTLKGVRAVVSAMYGSVADMRMR